MVYTFDDLCSPNFEYFEYHLAEQREFDFTLTSRIFTAFNENGRELAETIMAEETRIHESFQDHARHMTSCLYRRLIRGFEIPCASGPVATEYAMALFDNYIGLIEHRCLTREHANELEHYLFNLFSFAWLQTPCELASPAH